MTQAANIDFLSVFAPSLLCLDQLPARPQVCTGYADIDRLEIPRRLCEQAKLAERLQVVSPTIRETTADDLLASIGQIAPVRYAAYGPMAADWQPLNLRNTLTPIGTRA